ncbi:hypothetical protein [Micromonospora sp. CPCC 206061]|uniref:hypothetical protein n=1 Tax=Micromonospora sp. CPCC 206061 TaxID=3122410 RepID=UPI002FF3F1DD
MRIAHLRRFPALAALGLAAMAAAACGSNPVQALPVQTPSASPSATPSSTPSATAPAGPTTKPANSPKPGPINTGHSPPCLGAVEYRINVSDTGPWPQLCIAVGGVLRIANLGPEGFSQSTPDKAECEYEGGVRMCRLVEPGTARFTIDNGHQVRTLTVVVAKSSSRSSPACFQSGQTHTIDASEAGPSWWAVCMRLGAVLRVENLGPGLRTVTPSNAVSCQYAAGVHQCRIVKTGTFKVVTDGSGGVRSLTVVAIR